MHQTWGRLLFMHWPVAPETIQSQIPDGLAIDTFDGQAWIAITPFMMWNIRPTGLPLLPLLSEANELNVRTYVTYRGVPGVWFFSLDINHRLAAVMARLFFHLPYFAAEIEMTQQDHTTEFRLIRNEQARFRGRWLFSGQIFPAEPGSLEQFLVERYCLYTQRAGKLYRARIWHEPWPLQRADLDFYESNMIESNGIQTPSGAPLLHYANRLDVEIWPIHKLNDA